MRFLLVAIFCSISSLSYCSPKDDSILKLKKENRILKTELLRSDSIIKAGSDRLSVKVDYIEKYLNTRYDDLRVFVGSIAALLLVISGISYSKAKSTAKETAEEEFDKRFKFNLRRIKKIEADAQELLEKIALHYSSANSMIEHMGSLTTNADGKTKEIIGNMLDEAMQNMFQRMKGETK